ncbi:MAG: hypothetical protein QM713_13570 [Arachnia sp.]
MTAAPRRARDAARPRLKNALTVMTVVALAALAVAVQQRPARTAAPGGGPRASAEPTATPWRLPPAVWEPLPDPDPVSPLFPAQSAAINDLPVVPLTGCPTPRVVDDVEDWQAAVEEHWRCVHNSWLPVLAEQHLPTARPAVRFFSGDGADSDCGHVDAPAFYCAAGGGTVYFGDRHLAQARTWDLAVDEMVTHEYGHHLQALFGITAARLVAPGGLQLERRSELQAVCWSAAMTRSNDAVTFDEAAYDGWVARLGRMREDAAHGTRASLRSWGTRGLYAETMGDCNTWVAPPEAVR